MRTRPRATPSPRTRSASQPTRATSAESTPATRTSTRCSAEAQDPRRHRHSLPGAEQHRLVRAAGTPVAALVVLERRDGSTCSVRRLGEAMRWGNVVDVRHERTKSVTARRAHWLWNARETTLLTTLPLPGLASTFSHLFVRAQRQGYVAPRRERRVDWGSQAERGRST